jgi:hypothetical protein
LSQQLQRPARQDHASQHSDIYSPEVDTGNDIALFFIREDAAIVAEGIVVILGFTPLQKLLQLLSMAT